MLIADSMEELIEKFEKWKEVMETKGLQINMKKTDSRIQGFKDSRIFLQSKANYILTNIKSI